MAALAITDYREAIDRVAQTWLREMIGSSMLAALLSDRKDADEQLTGNRKQQIKGLEEQVSGTLQKSLGDATGMIEENGKSRR